MTTPLARAILLMKRDKELPVDLFIQLQNEGHNVLALERKYRV